MRDPRDDVPEKGLDAAVAKATYALPRIHFTKENWTLEPPAVVALLDEIKSAGIRLKDYVGGEPFYGIKTGLDEVFLINTAKRDQLLTEDPSLSALIRPYLRGQDIDRWSCAELWPVHDHDEVERKLSLAVERRVDEASAEKQFFATYPTLYRHFKRLEQFRIPRRKTSRTSTPRGPGPLVVGTSLLRLLRRVRSRRSFTRLYSFIPATASTKMDASATTRHSFCRATILGCLQSSSSRSCGGTTGAI